jgi:hypothetical protein
LTALVGWTVVSHDGFMTDWRESLFKDSFFVVLNLFGADILIAFVDKFTSAMKVEEPALHFDQKCGCE